MSHIPADLRYAKSHEWVRAESDGTVTIGITDYAQNSLGDITYVQVPKVGATLKAGETFGVVESVKAASDLYLPIAGTVVAVNPALDSAPETVNRAPYAEGWMLRVKPADAGSVVAVNPALDSAPETVNRAPYAEGWMLRVKPADAGSVAALLDAAAYTKLVS